MTVLAILALIVLLQAADVVTTAVALKRGGFDEINPIARKLFGFLGVVPAAIALKILFTAPMLAFGWFYPAWWPVPALFAASLVWVVWHNIRALRSGDS